MFDEKLIELIYDAPFVENGWKQVTAALEKPLGVRSSYLCLVDRQSGDLYFTKSANFSPDVNAEYVETYSTFDPAPAWAMQHAHEKLLFSDADFGPNATPAQNAYYDWFAKANGTSFRMGAHAVTQDDMVLALTLHRLTARGPATADDLQRFAPIARHMARALELQYRIGAQDNRVRALTEFYDHSEEAILFLDKKGCPTFSNAATERLAAEQDGLSLTADGLRFHRLSDDMRYRQALAAATAAIPAARSLLVPRPSGKRDYQVKLTPLGAQAVLIDPKAPRVAVQIADPDRATAPPEQWLMETYGLTPAEARLARRLAEGMTLRDASDVLGVAYSTVRSQLHAVFGKTGINRQSDLIRILTRSS